MKLEWIYLHVVSWYHPAYCDWLLSNDKWFFHRTKHSIHGHKKVQNICSSLQQRDMVITSDLAIYAKAKQIK